MTERQDDIDPAIIAAARSLAARARHDGITLTMLVQAATLRRRPEFAASLAYAIEAGWIAESEGVAGPGFLGPGAEHTVETAERAA